MKVLQVHTQYRQHGGEDNVVHAEAQLLRDAGHEVVQLLAANQTNAAKAAIQIGGSTWNLRQQRRAHRLALAERPDVAHIHNTWFALSPAVIHGLHSAGIPTVMTLHNYRLTCANALLIRDNSPCTLCVEGSAWNGVKYKCYRDSLPLSVVASGRVGIHRSIGTWGRIVDLFLPLSEFAEKLFATAGLPHDKMMVKPNFTEDPGPRLHVPSASKDVLFVGRLSPEKGVAVLLNAWRAAGLDDFKLQVVGDGPTRSELEHANRDLANVEFLGRVDKDEVRRLMLQSRALVVPSVWFEGAPLTILEAFACGLPVIASQLGAMEELVERLGKEWMASPNDPAILASRLQILRDDPIVTAAGTRARALYETRYHPIQATHTLIEAYERAAINHGAHA